jgi:uncharacterized membrane protein YczE
LFGDKQNIFKRSIVAILGVLVQAFGSALSLALNMGLDPYKAMNYGIAEQIGMTYGNLQLIVNILILGVVVFMKSDQLGWGTIFNMVLLGYAVDFFNNFFVNHFGLANLSFIVRLAIMVVAVIIFSLGVAMYAEPDLGVSPYDAIAPIVVAKTGWDYSASRVGQDILVIIVTLFLGGPIGISTIILGFFTGPLVDWFADNVTGPAMESLNVETEGIN